MWETPFDESMLSTQPGVAILCQEEQLAEELFEIFEAYGVTENWRDEEHETKWQNYGENTVYCVRGKNTLYGTKDSVESVSPYKNYRRCTFFGVKKQDFEVATDDELMAFLGL